MNQLDNTLDSHLEDWFAVLRPIPPRNEQTAMLGREKFLAQARSLSKTVSKTSDLRHRGWIDLIRYLIHNKEYSPMTLTVTSIVLVLSLLMGGAGVTVYAAQDSLPSQALYEVKTLSEDVATYLPISDAEKIELELNYASRRVNEINRMAMLDLDPPESVITRLEKHLDQVISLALNTREKDMMRMLLKIRERLVDQEKTLRQTLQSGPAIERAREAIQTRLQWAEFGLNDPGKFREQARLQNRYSQPPESSGGYGPGPGTNPDRESGDDGYGPGPHMMGTPTPGNGDGPGPEKDEEPPGYSPGPYATGTPTPGSGYGPGPGPDPSCTCTPGSGAGSNPDPGPLGGGHNHHEDPSDGSGKAGSPQH
jgi:hypothetical protein